MKTTRGKTFLRRNFAKRHRKLGKKLAKWQQSRAGKKGVVKLPKKNQQNKKKPK